MINVSRLKRGDLVKVLGENVGNGIKKGEIIRVIETGHSRWDRADYADCKSDNGAVIEIMFNYRDFELI